MASSTLPAAPASPHPSDLEPDTPAPIFAVRAFKHALFGTPAPPPREARKDVLPNTATLDSPSRRPQGILLTPGTGSNNRRKTVSFGGPGDFAAAITTPKGAPGTFPSPVKGGERDDGSASEADKKRASKLNEDLLKSKAQAQAATTAISVAAEKPTSHKPRRKNESSRAAASAAIARTTSNATSTAPISTTTDDLTTDLTHPLSHSGKYWKAQYETFSQNSTLELRKLAKKEQIAKKFAKQKDQAALELEDALRRERKRVATLEKEVAEYAQKVKAFGEKKRDGKEREKDGKMEVGKEQLKAVLAKEMKLEREIESLKRENEALKREIQDAKRAQQLPLPLPRHRPNPAPPTTALPSSTDIWADLSAPPPSPPPSSPPAPRRAPLTTSTNTSNANANAALSPRTRARARAQRPLHPTSTTHPDVPKIRPSASTYKENAPPISARGQTAAQAQDAAAVALSGNLSEVVVGGGGALTAERKEAARKRLEAKRASRVGAGSVG